MKTVKVFTLGCKANQYDSQSIRESFSSHGFKELLNGKIADFCVINTCTVTAAADRKSREAIRRHIRANPGARIIVTGCLIKEDSGQLERIKGIDYLIPRAFFPEGTAGFSGHTRAFLKVQDGCDNFCSYCKVPLVRGRSRSRKVGEIVREAECLVNKGFKELVLTGICLGAFGRDLKPKRNLVDLISSLEEIEGLARIRLSSIEAGDVTNELIRKISASEKLCPHLHIPIQSGDDLILKRMNRRYTSDGYAKLIRRIKDKIPEVAVTTDSLVGFPGETERQFRNTIKLIRRIRPLRTHVFTYSRRPGTAAGNMSGINPPAVLSERGKILKAIALECAKSYLKKFMNRELEVLFECRMRGNPGYWEGYSQNYIKVVLRSELDLRNKIIPVTVRSLSGEGVIGELQKI